MRQNSLSRLFKQQSLIIINHWTWCTPPKHCYFLVLTLQKFFIWIYHYGILESYVVIRAHRRFTDHSRICSRLIFQLYRSSWTILFCFLLFCIGIPILLLVKCDHFIWSIRSLISLGDFKIKLNILVVSLIWCHNHIDTGKWNFFFRFIKSL